MSPVIRLLLPTVVLLLYVPALGKEVSAIKNMPEINGLNWAVAAECLEKHLGDEITASLRGLGAVNDEIESILTYGETHGDFFVTLASDSVFHWEDQRMKDLAEEVGSPYFALISFGRILATPFVIKAARFIEQNLSQAVEQTASCPICGAAPAYLKQGRKDGRWLLVCSLCELHWEAQLMQCPFCGCQDQDKLGALMVADDAIRPIMTCDECKHYVKTIDERKLSDGEMIIPWEEDTITMTFDMVAEREGYQRPHY